MCFHIIDTFQFLVSHYRSCIPCNSVLQKLLSLIGIMFQMQETGFHVTRFMTIMHTLFWSPVVDSAVHTTQQNI
jgi:predicted nucleic acid-binding Zn ribbon protein